MSSTDSVTPDPPDPINELVRLFDEARSLAGEVGEQLATGAASEELTAKLKRQADTTTRLHSLLAEFSMDKTGRPRPEVLSLLEQMRSEFEALVKATADNHESASVKGVRVAGVGGRPYARGQRNKQDG